mmetsp:Transcript_24988/g.54036  ORF Transcript_24988/g.54036 Transcript_24988/m.54036 type:complete len:174 (-) Transcript_24988:1406-1927(-)
MSNLCLLFLTMFLAMPTVSRCLERSAVARVRPSHLRVISSSEGHGGNSAIRLPKFLAAPNGDVVPYPLGLRKEIHQPSIYNVGTESLKIFLPDWAINSEKINKAQENYVKDRPQLLTVCRGSWVACSSLGEVVVAPTEESVLGVARQFFQPQDRSVDYFMACMGSEFTEVAEM